MLKRNERTYPPKRRCTRMFIQSKAKKTETTRCPSIIEWVNKLGVFLKKKKRRRNIYIGVGWRDPVTIIFLPLGLALTNRILWRWSCVSAHPSLWEFLVFLSHPPGILTSLCCAETLSSLEGDERLHWGKLRHPVRDQAQRLQAC